jgi:hypothetical protein
MGNKRRGLGRSPLHDDTADITTEDIGFLLDQLVYWRCHAHMLECELSKVSNGRDRPRGATERSAPGE